MTSEELETEMERNIDLIIAFQLFMYENGFISNHLWDFERMANKFLNNTLKKMSKLPSFEYKKMIFHNVKDNLFQTDRFGDKLIYKFENGKYHLVKDERLSSVISLSECTSNDSQSYINDDNNWK